MSRNDIKTCLHSIGGRQGWAYICNSGKFPVIKADFSTPTKYDDKTCSLDYSEGEFSFGSGGCCLSARFGFDDALELVADANLPIIRPNDIVAIAKIVNKADGQAIVLEMFKLSGRIDINCMTVAKLEPLSDEEMKELVADAERWCNR